MPDELKAEGEIDTTDLAGTSIGYSEIGAVGLLNVKRKFELIVFDVNGLVAEIV